MHKILIVDDEPSIRHSLKGVLEDEGYKVSVAESGEACLESIRKTAVDVVLLDVWLTGIDGLETLTKIREVENGPEVIMISGHGTIETASMRWTPSVCARKTGTSRSN
jgi:two-component system nitrogen regulation response regulator NtrX